MENFHEMTYSNILRGGINFESKVFTNDNQLVKFVNIFSLKNHLPYMVAD